MLPEPKPSPLSVCHGFSWLSPLPAGVSLLSVLSLNHRNGAGLARRFPRGEPLKRSLFCNLSTWLRNPTPERKPARTIEPAIRRQPAIPVPPSLQSPAVWALLCPAVSPLPCPAVLPLLFLVVLALLLPAAFRRLTTMTQGHPKEALMKRDRQLKRLTLLRTWVRTVLFFFD